jgi:hypothetical protein
MDTAARDFWNFLTGIGAHNFLWVGIAIIILWLLVSGLRRGLRHGKGTEKGKH